jgi:N-acetylneuraminic acid mutarotase
MSLVAAIAAAATVVLTATSCTSTAESTTGSAADSPNAGATASAPAPATTVHNAPLVAATASWRLDRAWSRAIVLNDHDTLLVYSGLDAAKRSLSRVVRIDSGTGKLEDLPKLPRVLHDAAGALLTGNALLVGGGEQESGTRAVTAVTGPGAPKDLGQLPQPRSDVAATTVGDTVYVVGGYDGTRLTPTVLASADGRSFTSVGDLPTPVRYPAVITSGDGQIYVFGGKTATGQTDDIQRIDPHANTITTVAHLPTPLGHAVAFMLGGQIYIAGGRAGTSTTDTGNTVSDQILAFDPTTLTIRPAGTLPYPVADTGAAVVGAHAYIVGGERDGNDTAVATVIDVHE